MGQAGGELRLNIFGATGSLCRDRLSRITAFVAGSGTVGVYQPLYPRLAGGKAARANLFGHSCGPCTPCGNASAIASRAMSG
ncbi:hypothetical protein Bxe_C0887 [Paraburkholderia xenovorans LB400]|uniref:Uncharacterized protein n=1 Tax=Paraburkholderia xenovorans (strain LB400) TaxID=266265 RepID=Q13GM7_PARXL|nr:hypothetical protein Bxe_C0887 [Paraburkholderia xenovorans LB400]